MSEMKAVVDHLFRHEAGKMVATLVRSLGLRHLGLAEDAVQDALCGALEVWKYRGIPENPSAWLYQAARHRAVDLLRRRKTQDRALPALARRLPAGIDEGGSLDDQLRMLCACVHPQLPPEAQVAVVLKFLGGFSVPEIAQAFLTSVAAIEKRLSRAKRAFRDSPLKDLPEPGSLGKRLEEIHQAIYLLFNEGYHGSHPERSVREELCAEALRLGTLLANHPATATAATFALLGLLCLHFARLASRVDDAGSLILLEAQDRSRWSRPLMEQGFQFLNQSAQGKHLTTFHLEAGIAALHAQARSFAETDWASILKLYSLLYRLKPTPIVALNRAIALGRAVGPEAGLEALQAIPGKRRLNQYPFFEAAAGDLHLRAGRLREAGIHFDRALKLARNDAERGILRRKRDALT